MGDLEYKPRAKWKYLCIAVAVALVIATAVLVPVGVLVIGKHHGGDTKNDQNNDAQNRPASAVAVPNSAKGTILDPSLWRDKTDFNTSYTDVTVGGLSIMGLNSTWNDSARANVYVPALNEPWDYSKRAIRGVNVGGWLVLEPFVTPSLFNYDSSLKIVDEYTLSKYLGPELNKTLEDHYSNWVTEDTMREIAEAGLDHIRIPFPYWVVKTYPDDPYLPQIAWRYLLRGIEWARKYGLRVALDLHAVPGSQNGWNHSGRQGQINWLNGTNGGENGNKTLDIHNQLARFFAQDRYKNVVAMYEIVNEPNLMTLNQMDVVDWTKRAYKVIRNAGFDNYLVYSDGFLGPGKWRGVFDENEYPKLVIDLHHYTIFNKDVLSFKHSERVNFACKNWADDIRTSSDTSTGQGPTIVGEFSLADNDCTLYINSVGDGPRWTGNYLNLRTPTQPILSPSCPGGLNCTCEPSDRDPKDYPEGYAKFLGDYGQSQMDTFENHGSWGFFYWTWDVENVTASQWSYKKSIIGGMLPAKNYDRTFYCNQTIPTYETLSETF